MAKAETRLLRSVQSIEHLARSFALAFLPVRFAVAFLPVRFFCLSGLRSRFCVCILSSMLEWDDNKFPLAYLITIRTYGTWLHGDERGSVDVHGKNVFGSPKISHKENLRNRMQKNLKDEAFIFNQKQRQAIEESIKETCQIRGYELLAVNVRTNHLHAVVSALSKPEIIINGFKSHGTRKLSENYLIVKDTRVWSRGGSNRYLWKKPHVDEAIDYVLYSQGLLPFELKK